MVLWLGNAGSNWHGYPGCGLADTWGRDLAVIGLGIPLTHQCTIIGRDPRIPGDLHSTLIRLGAVSVPRH